MKTYLGVFSVVVGLAGMCALGTDAHAAGGAADRGEWTCGAEVYMWGASIEGTATAGGDIQIDFEDLLGHLNMAAMAAFEARNGPYSLMLDGIYMDVEDDTALGSSGKLDVDLKGLILTPSVGYQVVQNERVETDLLVGARYLDLDTDATVEVDAPAGRERKSGSASGDAWDAVVGVRGKVHVAEPWYLPYYLDIGAGDSKVTWQAFAGVGYHFSRVDLILAYRYLAWEFDGSSAFDDLDMSGPFAGIKFTL